jgi:hypothetical protein
MNYLLHVKYWYYMNIKTEAKYDFLFVTQLMEGLKIQNQGFIK